MEVNVGGVVTGHEDDVGASSLGFADIGAALDPELLGFIGGGDARGGVGHRGNDGDGFSAKLGVELLFDGREVAVEIEEHRSQR